MFEVGDKVWSKTKRYSMTSYHRPCKVVRVDSFNRMIVEVIDTGKYYSVETKEFESIIEDDILKFGDILSYKGERVIFLKYQDYSTILCNTLDESPIRVEIKDIRKIGGFFV